MDVHSVVEQCNVFSWSLVARMIKKISINIEDKLRASGVPTLELAYQPVFNYHSYHRDEM